MLHRPGGQRVADLEKGAITHLAMVAGRLERVLVAAVIKWRYKFCYARTWWDETDLMDTWRFIDTFLTLAFTSNVCNKKADAVIRDYGRNVRLLFN